MRRRGPIQGTPNAADPATVEQRGFSIRFEQTSMAGRMVWPMWGMNKLEKPLEWQSDVPGLDASLSTNRPPFRFCRMLWEGEGNLRASHIMAGLTL